MVLAAASSGGGDSAFLACGGQPGPDNSITASEAMYDGSGKVAYGGGNGGSNAIIKDKFGDINSKSGDDATKIANYRNVASNNGIVTDKGRSIFEVISTIYSKAQDKKLLLEYEVVTEKKK
ncbi:MAG: hypothetical protein U0T83_00680 [Bacteriovoracaceae bacterium]